MTEASFTITVYDGTVGADVLDETITLYRDVYAEPPYLEGVLEFADFAEDLPRRASCKSFRLVVARVDEFPVGFALGHRLPSPTRWWDGAIDTIPDHVTKEREGRTFAVIELAVSAGHRRRGVGRHLHSHLIVDLEEERRTLLVRPEALPALSAYRSWDYHKVGRIQPYSGAPVYEAMISGAGDRSREAPSPED